MIILRFHGLEHVLDWNVENRLLRLSELYQTLLSLVIELHVLTVRNIELNQRA